MELVYLPWQRAIYSMGQDDFAGFLPAYYSEERDGTLCHYSEPFPGGSITFVHLRERTLRFNTFEDLKDLTFGVVAGYLNFPEFDTATYLRKDPSNDDLTNVRKLLARRIDVAVGDPVVLNYLYRKHFSHTGNELAALFPALAERPLYICFNPKHPAVEHARDIFDSQLKIMRQEGRVQQLYEEFTHAHMPAR